MDISRCYDAQGNVITHFTQWDYGLQIYFSGDYDDYDVYVDFCNDNSTESYRVVPTIDDDGRYCADVPNILLQEPVTIYAFVVISNDESLAAKTGILGYAITNKSTLGDAYGLSSSTPNGDSVVTKFVFVIPVYQKIKPADYVYKDNLDIVSVIELQKEMQELMEIFTNQENRRQSNEEEREDNEAERQANEEERQANEEERQENETERQAAEEAREAQSAEDHANAEEATKNANEAAENANEAAEEAREASKGDIEVVFDEAEVFENIESGEDLSTIFGKIQKFFDDPITDEEIDYLFDQYKEVWYADEYVVDDTILPDYDRATALLGECVVGEAVLNVPASE